MATSLSPQMQFLYFPIKWDAGFVNSRALAYMIYRAHDTVRSQLFKMFGSKLQPVQHKHDYVKNGQRVQFEVMCYHLTHEQFILYLAQHGKMFKAHVQDCLAHEVDYANIVLPTNKIEYGRT